MDATDKKYIVDLFVWLWVIVCLQPPRKPDANQASKNPSC